MPRTAPIPSEDTSIDFARAYVSASGIPLTLYPSGEDPLEGVCCRIFAHEHQTPSFWFPGSFLSGEWTFPRMVAAGITKTPAAATPAKEYI